MRTEFSESTFAFTYTYEVASLFRPIMVSAPQIPSLRAEHDLGADLALGVEGWVYFAQFKVPTYLSRATATHWSYYNAEHFRLEIGYRADTHQHDSLIRLANRSGAYMVEYVAPRFYRSTELNAAFLSNSLIDRSLRLRATSLRANSLPTADQTYVTYQQTGPPTFWSEPTQISGEYNFGDLREPTVDAGPMAFGADAFQRIYRDLLDLSPDSPSSFDALMDAQLPLARAHLAARLLLGLEMILIPAHMNSTGQSWE